MHCSLTSIISHPMKYDEKCSSLASKLISHSEIICLVAQNPSIPKYPADNKDDLEFTCTKAPTVEAAMHYCIPSLKETQHR